MRPSQRSRCYPPIRATSTTSDLRYALEAVTHMARTNADAMRSVAESQAEWIKAISSARGFFRNAPALQLAAPSEQVDDEEDDEPALKPSWIEALQPAVGMVVQQLVSSVMAPKGTTVAGEAPSKLQLADLFDWRRAAGKREAASLPESTAIDPKALQQALAGKAVAVGALLDPSERTRLVKLAPMLVKLAADPEVARMLAEVVAMSVEDSAAWVRAHLDELERGLAS